jgi:hypothetical protein
MEAEFGFLDDSGVRPRKVINKLTNSTVNFEKIMQEKRELDLIHNNIVLKALNPYLNQQNIDLSKKLLRNKDFIRKKVHHILPCNQNPRKKYRKPS